MPRSPASHPRTKSMVRTAIKRLDDGNGSSLNFISQFYNIDGKKQIIFTKKYIKKAVSEGELKQVSGRGACGSFKLPASNKGNSSPSKSIINISDSPDMKKTRSKYEFGDISHTSNKENSDSSIESVNGDGDFKKNFTRTSDLPLKESLNFKQPNSVLNAKVVLTPFDFGGSEKILATSTPVSKNLRGKLSERNIQRQIVNKLTNKSSLPTILTPAQQKDLHVFAIPDVIRLAPGKKWQRSLSILRKSIHCSLDAELSNQGPKGRKWRSSIVQVQSDNAADVPGTSGPGRKKKPAQKSRKTKRCTVEFCS